MAVAALDALREVDLLGGGQQIEAVDLPQEELERVRGDGRERVVRVGHLLGDLAPAVVLQLDPAGLDLVEQVLDRASGRSSSSASWPTSDSSMQPRLLAICEQRPDALVRPAVAARGRAPLARAPHLALLISPQRRSYAPIRRAVRPQTMTGGRLLPPPGSVRPRPNQA